MKKLTRLFVATAFVCLTTILGQASPEMSRYSAKPLTLPTMPQRASANSQSTPVVELIGSILNDDSRIGLYSFSSDGVGGFTHKTTGPYATHGGVLHDGKYFYGMYAPFMGMYLSHSSLLDVANNYRTIREINDDQSQALMAKAMANNPVTNQVYGCFHSANGSKLEFGIVDVDNFTRTTIATLPVAWEAAGFTSDGTLYVVLHTGELATVNLATGANTIVGQTGLPIQDTTSGTIDYKTNTFYFATCSASDKALYTIDLATATPTKLFDMPGGEQIGGMFIYYPSNTPTAPAEVSDIVANFSNGALDGAISFTAPTTTFNGSALSGTLSYEVKLNSSSIASGNCLPGANVSAPVSVNQTGEYLFEITVSNANGTSIPVKIRTFIGIDAPASPGNVVLTASGLNFNLTWDAVTESAHGGYMDTSSITYNVTRYPGNVQVATGLTTTSFTETVDQPANVTTFYYTVEAVAGGIASESAQSNAIVSGYIVPPFTETFSTAACLEPFTIIDANNDGKTWELYAPTTTVGYIRSEFHLTNTSDDWLITAPIMLEAEKIYDLTYDIRAFHASYPERYEVCIGNAATVEAMTRVLVEPTILTSKDYTKIAVPITVNETGLYYIGFHSLSDANHYYVCLDNLSIAAPTSLDTPDVVTDFSVTPDYYGAIQGLVKFRTPTLSINGNQLTKLTKVVVKRGEDVVHTFGECQPGDTLSFIDRANEIGQYSYSIVAYNELGTGTTFTASARLGVNLLTAVSNPQIEETTTGTVKLTWEAPTTDIEGFPISPDVAHYAILDKSGINTMAEDLADTEFSIDVVAKDGKQIFVFYYIMTQTAAGVNTEDYAYTPQIAVGPAYNYPFYDSFSGASSEHVWAVTRNDNGNATWVLAPEAQQPVALPQDKDGGLAGFMPYATGEEANMHSGKIAIPGNAIAPQLSFYYYAVAGAADELDVMIAPAHGEFAKLKTIKLSDAGTTGWTRVLIPLDSYKGQTIEIGFNGRCITHQNLILIDNISVADIFESNVTAESFYAPTKMIAGTTGTFKTVVHNRGINKATNIKVALKCGDQTIASQDIAELDADSNITVAFSVTPSVFTSGIKEYYAEIIWDADMHQEDNCTTTANVTIIEPTLPAITDLEATQNDGNITLTWGEPDVTTATARSVCDTFESYASFAVNNAGEWTFIDGDQGATYGIEGIEFPNNGTPMAFIVFDNSIGGLDNTFNMASGNKCLVSMANSTGITPNDDWAISPKLDGSSQTVRFDVRSYTNQYGYDSFEFLYSTTDTKRESFVKLAENKEVPTDWTTCEYTLPEGALYFAIRCTSYDTFMFMVDNVEYISAATPTLPTILGYNIYRDAEKIAGPLEEQTFTEQALPGRAYNVTTVYATGESAPSNTVRSLSGGIGSIDSDNVTAIGRTGIIEISHADGIAIEVYAPNGICIYRASDSDRYNITAPAGLYLVKAGNRIIKVMVK